MQDAVPSQCLNCAAPMVGPYCSECGQHAANPHPTVGQIVRDAVEELLQWDGKVARSFRLLVMRPGVLTTEYVSGRRARFVSPMKIYLLCSALFFFVNAVVPSSPPRASDSGKNTGGLIETMAKVIADKPIQTRVDTSSLSGRFAASRNRSLGRVKSDPRGFEARAQSVLPSAMFLLVPALAVLLGLTFRRSAIHYPQHLIFMLHAQAFFFLVLAVQQLSELAPIPVISALVSFGVFAAYYVYLVLAARRVYQRSIISTIVRVSVFVVGYFLLWLLAISASFELVASTY